MPVLSKGDLECWDIQCPSRKFSCSLKTSSEALADNPNGLKLKRISALGCRVQPSRHGALWSFYYAYVCYQNVLC